MKSIILGAFTALFFCLSSLAAEPEVIVGTVERWTSTNTIAVICSRQVMRNTLVGHVEYPVDYLRYGGRVLDTKIERANQLELRPVNVNYRVTVTDMPAGYARAGETVRIKCWKRPETLPSFKMREHLSTHMFAGTER